MEDASAQLWDEVLFEERPPEATRRLLGELLVGKGLISDDELAHALASQKAHGGRLGEILIAENWISLAQLTAAVSEQCGLGGEASNSLRARLAARRSA